MHIKSTFIAFLIGLIFSLTPLSEAAIEVSIPDLIAESGTAVIIPVEITEVVGLRSMGFTVEFDPEVLIIDTVKKGDTVSNFLLAHNIVSLGALRIGLASGRGVKGQGAVVFIHATVKARPTDGHISPLRLAEVRINGGEIEVTPKDGELIIDKEVAVPRRGVRLTTWGRLKRGS